MHHVRLIWGKVCLFSFLVLSVAAAAGEVQAIKIVNDKAPDCSSLESIAQTVTRGCKDDDEKAVAIYNFMRYVNYHFIYPSEKGGIGALKHINVYGWAVCGGGHSVLSAVYEKAGFKHRFLGWPGHTTIEIEYGGKWHFLDTFLKFYTWMPDANAPGGYTIAGQADIANNPKLVSDVLVQDTGRDCWYQKHNLFERVGPEANWTAPAFLVCRDTIPGVIEGCQNRKEMGNPRSWSGLNFDDPEYSTDVNLGLGYSLTLDWSKIDGAHWFAGKAAPPKHTCGDRDFRNCASIGPILEPYRSLAPSRSYSNGTLLFKPDLSDAEALSVLAKKERAKVEGGAILPTAAEPAVLEIPVSSPYVVTKGFLTLTFKEPDAGAKQEISTDGKSWKPVQAGEFSPAVAGTYAYTLRLTFSKPISALEVKTIVQHNEEALPFLAPGKNTITISAKNPEALAGQKLAITYGYYTGNRTRDYGELCDQGAEVAKGHSAAWSKDMIVVQKVIEKLPATLEILIPTPKGKQPIYPRMAFLRREVLSAKGTPLPVPAAPSEPKVTENDTLAEMPWPFTLGTQKPGAKPKSKAATKVQTVALDKQQYLSKKGELFETHWLKTLKDDSDAWVLLACGDLKGISAKELASIKLVFYASDAHDKGDMQVGAFSLKAPFEKGKAYDFANLGASLGTAVVKKNAGETYKEPVRYEIDLTAGIRGLLKGDGTFNGLCLRGIPNKDIDEGYIVRFTPAANKPPVLEVETYVIEKAQASK